MSKNSRLVYSTETGRVKPEADSESVPQASPDGIVRLHRETKGRGGKSVTLVKGLGLADGALKTLGKELKKHCGVGGSIKDGVIEIQGEQREKIKAFLESKGHKVKIAG